MTSRSDFPFNFLKGSFVHHCSLLPSRLFSPLFLSFRALELVQTHRNTGVVKTFFLKRTLEWSSTSRSESSGPFYEHNNNHSTRTPAPRASSGPDDSTNLTECALLLPDPYFSYFGNEAKSLGLCGDSWLRISNPSWVDTLSLLKDWRLKDGWTFMLICRIDENYLYICRSEITLIKGWKAEKDDNVANTIFF